MCILIVGDAGTANVYDRYWYVVCHSFAILRILNISNFSSVSCLTDYLLWGY